MSFSSGNVFFLVVCSWVSILLFWSVVTFEYDADVLELQVCAWIRKWICVCRLSPRVSTAQQLCFLSWPGKMSCFLIFSTFSLIDLVVAQPLGEKQRVLGSSPGADQLWKAFWVVGEGVRALPRYLWARFQTHKYSYALYEYLLQWAMQWAGDPSRVEPCLHPWVHPLCDPKM